jgi:molybdopterin-guanine dinucleotide biosynthesis protein A
MRYFAVYERSIRNAISRRLRENKKCDISPFTREQEMRYLAVYEGAKMRYFAVYERSIRNAISRRLRENKKCDISPFMREQEMRYLPVYERAKMRYFAVYERSTIKFISRRLRENKKCDISPFTREQEMRYFAVYERSIRNAISRRLRENKKCDISPFTREQEMRYLAVYEREIHAIFRRLREKYKKFDISPFTREQEMRYLAVYERSTRNNLNQTGWRDSDRAKHSLTHIFNVPLKNGHAWKCYTLRTSADFFSTILTSATRSRYRSFLMFPDWYFCMHVHPPIMLAALSFHAHLHVVLKTADWRKRSCPLRKHQSMQDTTNGAIERTAKLFCILEVLASVLGLKTR